MPMKKETVKNIIKIVFAVAIFVTAIVNYDYLSNLDVRVLIAGASSLLIAELIILGVYSVKAVLMVIPASLIYISVGMAFDTKRAVIVNLLGIAIEVTVTFFMGKFLGKDAVEKKIRNTKAGDKFFSMLDKNRNVAVFLMRFRLIFHRCLWVHLILNFCHICYFRFSELHRESLLLRFSATEFMTLFR